MRPPCRGPVRCSRVDELTYTVADMSCSHCEHAVASGISRVDGVHSVEVDLATNLVRVEGEHLDDVALRAAIADAGYTAA